MLSTIQKIILLLSFLGASLLLSSCGFHLRGTVILAPPLKNIYLETNDPYSELTRNFKQTLKASHASLAKTPQTATTILEIISSNESQQLLSVGGTQQTRQYNLTLTVSYQVKTPAGKILISPQSVTETQAITIQANQVLGGSNEQNNLYHQMRRTIVNMVMTRLASKTATASVMETSS
jgi:LPS-assembly lipoprotein